jgi:transcriptional regulator with XRE-family HTH domain
MTRPAPTLRVRRLARELRQLREDAGLSQEAVAERTRISRTTVVRIEGADRPPLRRNLLALLDLYGVYGPKREALLNLLENADQTEWVRRLGEELPGPYTAYIELESEASSISSYQPGLIPGLLQTEGYARAQALAALPTATSEEIEARVFARIERQAAFAERAARLFSIITEAALWWEVGGRDLQCEQLLRLLDAFESRNVTLAVIPFSAGAHPSMMASFAVLDFNGDPPVVYAENAGGAVLLEDPTDVDGFRAVHTRLAEIALDPSGSHRLIAETLRKIQERHTDNDRRSVVQELP